MPVKLTSALPKTDEYNGLDAITKRLIDDPRQTHYAVVVVDCIRVTEDMDSDETWPTARLRRIEIIDGNEAAQVQRLIETAHERRTGRAMLPLDEPDAATEPA